MDAIPSQKGAELTVSYLSLSHKPTAKLAYTFVPSKFTLTSITEGPPSLPLIVFLNGLGLPAASFYPAMTLLSSAPIHPALLAYDRYGQGMSTDRDPLDVNAEDPKHGHTVSDVVYDLHHLIHAICAEYNLNQHNQAPPIIFVANSIGCAIARVYAASFPDTVSGLLLLDSLLANSDFISVFPTTEELKDGRKKMPEGVTVEVLNETREKIRRVFHPDQGSAEGLSRKNLKTLLPHSDGPRLVYNDGRAEDNKKNTENGPWVTVAGHGWDKFAEDNLKGMGIPIALSQTYSNPYWHEYNIGLTNITSLERARGPILVEKAGHFIQKDDPKFVVEEVKGMLRRMGIVGL
ncbi:hypothetical protein BP6252_08219 [Coleophoma cylindrospora]|uniref:AB hydrolase-1 domain-containing protein n=1 Tax=Coleophoma cylindrospora TaxID=1849047 RepID=A0A3D8R586_9HELO|nr:hypothetical protein BP6252_08219 [Coleophoma cylindrospora]